jgi:glycosyltransferase involved in cell wall biosynthesis
MTSISAIIPSYNRAQWLADAIRSVLAQTLPVEELIVVDDGSTDETRALLESDEFKRFREQETLKVIHTGNRGVSAARNLGVREAKGNWIAFLDSDDHWLPQKIETQLAFHRARPELKASHTQEIWVRNGKRVNACHHHRKEGGDLYLRSLELCFISPSTLMIEKRYFDAIGGFDEQLRAAEDYDLWLRVSAEHDIGFCPEKLTQKHGGHKDQLSAERGLDRYRVLAMEKMMTHSRLKPVYRERTLEQLLRRYELLVKGFRKHGHHEQADQFQQRLLHWQSI